MTTGESEGVPHRAWSPNELLPKPLQDRRQHHRACPEPPVPAGVSRGKPEQEEGRREQEPLVAEIIDPLKDCDTGRRDPTDNRFVERSLPRKQTPRMNEKRQGKIDPGASQKSRSPAQSRCGQAPTLSPEVGPAGAPGGDDTRS